jgi:hypothetical protein
LHGFIGGGGDGGGEGGGGLRGDGGVLVDSVEEEEVFVLVVVFWTFSVPSKVYSVVVFTLLMGDIVLVNLCNTVFRDGKLINKKFICLDLCFILDEL